MKYGNLINGLANEFYSMIATGTILMTVGFPGAFFPEISIRSKCRQKLLNEETLNLRSVEHE